MSYNIKALAQEASPRPKGAQVALPKIEERIGSVKEYRIELRKMLRRIAKETREGVIPAYQADQRRKAITQDSPDEWVARLYALRESLTASVGREMESILASEAERHSKTFIQAAKRSLGIDISAVVRREGLETALNAARARNASLITGLADDTIRSIEQRVHVAFSNGSTVKDLRADLQKQFGIAGRRAELIAQDQISKLNSDLNRIRQTEAGVDQYEWLTSQDERVRSLHRALNGKVYKWGEPTGAEGGLPPGQPIRCRCVAIGVVTF